MSMKSLLKRIAGPVLRPIRDALRRFLAGAAGRALDERKVDREFVEELTLLLDSLLAEQIRLRERIDDLEHTLRAAHAEAPAPKVEPAAEAQ